MRITSRRRHRPRSNVRPGKLTLLVGNNVTVDTVGTPAQQTSLSSSTPRRSRKWPRRDTATNHAAVHRFRQLPPNYACGDPETSGRPPKTQVA